MALSDLELRQIRAFFFPNVVIDKPKRPARPSLLLSLAGALARIAALLMIFVGGVALLIELYLRIGQDQAILVQLNTLIFENYAVYNLRIPLFGGGIFLLLAASLYILWRKKRRESYEDALGVHEQIMDLRKATQDLHKSLLKTWQISEKDIQNRITWNQAYDLLKKLFREHQADALNEMQVFEVDADQAPIFMISPLLREIPGVPTEQIFAQQRNSEGKILTPYYEAFIFYPMNQRLAVHNAVLNALWGEVVSSSTQSYFYNNIMSIQLKVAVPLDVTIPLPVEGKNRGDQTSRRIRVRFRTISIELDGGRSVDVRYKHEISDSERPETDREQFFNTISDDAIKRLIKIWQDHKGLQNPGIGSTNLPPGGKKSAPGSLPAGDDLF